MKTNKSIRLRTEPGSSKNINVKIEQDFDTIDFLSLKITQDEAYRNFCSDYGVVAGRVIANDGFGVENAKISIFIPLSDEDAEDPIISSLYPYITPNSVNGEGIRYNLLPKNGKTFTITKSVPNDINGFPQSPLIYGNQNYTPLGTYTSPTWAVENLNLGVGRYSIYSRQVTTTQGPTVPVGTFPSKFEILDNDTLLEVYDKYYKYTTKTNGSGDYMIFGVPIGTKTVHMDVDLSDTGAASLTVDDYTNLGFPPQLFDGNKFKSSTNLDELPQIESQNIAVDVIPFWGNTEQCQIGITRLDFKLTKTITPSAILFFQAFTNYSNWYIKASNCNIGNNGVSGSENFRSIGRMVQLGVTVEATATANGQDIQPLTFNNGNVIYPLPMYEDRFITNEFGDYVPSTDPNRGIPTGGRYKIYAYSNQRNITDTDGDDYGYGTYIIPSSNQFIKYKYDLKNRKKLLYTPGNWNGATTSGLADDDDKISIAGNQDMNSARNRYPVTYKNGGEDRWGRLNGDGSTPICYGSLYFMRLGYKNDEVCNKVASINSNSYPGGGVVYYNSQLGCKNVLDVTDVIKFFKDFGGGIDAQSSAYLGIYSTGSPFPTSSNPDTKNHAIPLGSTGIDINGVVEFEDRLNEEDLSVTNTNTTITNIVSNSGENSKEGWYYFFFGLLKNNNSLTNLKNNLGV